MTLPGQFENLRDGEPEISQSLRELGKVTVPKVCNRCGARAVFNGVVLTCTESLCGHKDYRFINSPQPEASDFTEIVASVTTDGEYAVRLLLESGPPLVVGRWVCREEAKRDEAAIHQAMTEFRLKRNEWNDKH